MSNQKKNKGKAPKRARPKTYDEPTFDPLWAASFKDVVTGIGGGGRGWVSAALGMGAKRTRGRGHPPGMRRRTRLRNEMAAISQLQKRRPKEIAADLYPDREDAAEQVESTYDYFSHHREEIEMEKVRLEELGPSEQQLRELYRDSKSALTKTLAPKNHTR